MQVKIFGAAKTVTGSCYSLIKEKEKVVEIKSNNINAHDYLKSLLPLPRSRFSKYCRGVELLNLY